MTHCDLCNVLICKYHLDFNSCGGIVLWIGSNLTKEKFICHDCAKRIAQELIDQ